MARAPIIFPGVHALLVAGCDKQRVTWQPPTPSPAAPQPAVIPSPVVVTLATQADIAAAKKAPLDAAILKAVGDYLGSESPRWKVIAARDLGDYVLLWVAFPDMADGGIDLVYSKPEQRVNWQFKGGERG